MRKQSFHFFSHDGSEGEGFESLRAHKFIAENQAILLLEENSRYGKHCFMGARAPNKRRYVW